VEALEQLEAAMMNNWHGGTWGWDGWLSMSAMMLVFAGAAIALAVWAALWATRSTSSHRSFETPRAVLDRRLAAGEIDADEYARARQLLEQEPAGAR
jgi:uncharacterized membrane protein